MDFLLIYIFYKTMILHKLFIIILFLIINLYFYFLVKYGFGYTRTDINFKNWFSLEYKLWIICMIIIMSVKNI